jgi:hypothetical protein
MVASRPMSQRTASGRWLDLRARADTLCKVLPRGRARAMGSGTVQCQHAKVRLVPGDKLLNYTIVFLTVVNCGEPGSPAHGSAQGSSFEYQRQVVFSCDTGHTLSGLATVTCQASGQWSAPTPACNRKITGTLKWKTSIVMHNYSGSMPCSLASNWRIHIGPRHHLPISGDVFLLSGLPHGGESDQNVSGKRPMEWRRCCLQS